MLGPHLISTDDFAKLTQDFDDYFHLVHIPSEAESICSGIHVISTIPFYLSISLKLYKMILVLLTMNWFI